MKRILSVFVLAGAASCAFAGGLLTNTNQSVNFLRNPARDAAISIDGVYSNPAGVAFMNEGWHLGFNWQSAWQTRTVNTTNELFKLGVDNNGATTKEYEGKARAPFLPSVQAAYNTGKWSFQFNFAVTGGGGKCEFDNGLGSFESAVGKIASALSSFGAQGYDANYYMRGRQYYFGFTLGAAYRINDHWSVYGGLRGLYGTASYKARISDIQVKTANGMVPFNTFLNGVNEYIASSLTAVEQGLSQVNGGINQYGAIIAQYGESALNESQMAQLNALQEKKAQLLATQTQLQDAQPQVEALDVYSEGVNLQSDQTGFGIAPILGVDYKVGNFNFAAKYEFRTRMSMKNESTLKEAMAIDAVNQFQDGKSVREDSPALLTVGAQWSIIPSVRVNAGYHHFFDEQSKKYGDKQKLLKHGTNEYLGGIEVDPIKKLTVSGGVQFTRYGLSDEFMSDLSFVTNSWTFGVGAKYQITDKVAVNAAYFQTNYSHYKTATPDANGSLNDYTRTNNVCGVGVDIDF